MKAMQPGKRPAMVMMHGEGGGGQRKFTKKTGQQHYPLSITRSQTRKDWIEQHVEHWVVTILYFMWVVFLWYLYWIGLAWHPCSLCIREN